MYQVSLFNNNVETVVHYPSADSNDPHIVSLPLKEGLSMVDTLSFKLYTNGSGYDKLFELVTKVKVFDRRDNTIRFTGRVLNVDEKMDNDGKIYKEITCEGALGYLNDTKQRGSSFVANDVSGFLTQILSVHNSKVDPGKQIYVGSVNIASQVIHTCSYLSTLAEILSVREVIGGDILVREVNGSLYMDWLESFDESVVEVSLGVNMKDMIIARDITSLGSRIVPLGANNITIETVNNGYDYVEETNAKNVFGVIEKTVEYKDITDPYILLYTCLLDLPIHTQPIYVLKSNALDLSFITGNKAEQFTLGKRLNIVNRYMGVNDIYKIVTIDLDLLQPYNPTLTIANKPVTLSSTISDLRKSTIQNNGIYNNVQIGSAFGIRAVRSDNGVITTLNATEGISIQNATKKVFYVDVNGNLVCNDLTANDITANGGTYNDINVNQGTFTDITAEGGTFDNIEATNGITITDGDASCAIAQNGITLTSGDYSTRMQVRNNSQGNASALEFDDDVYVGRTLHVAYFAFFEEEVEINGNLVINGSSINTIIGNKITDMVKADSLKPAT